MTQRGGSRTSLDHPSPEAAGAMRKVSRCVENTSVSVPRLLGGGQCMELSQGEENSATPRMVLACPAVAASTLDPPEAEGVGLSAAVFKLEPVQHLAQGWGRQLQSESPMNGDPRWSFVMDRSSLGTWDGPAACPAYACSRYDTRPIDGKAPPPPIQKLPHSRNSRTTPTASTGEPPAYGSHGLAESISRVDQNKLSVAPERLGNCPSVPKALRASVAFCKRDHAASRTHQAITPVYADTGISSDLAHHAIVMTIGPEEATDSSASPGDPTVVTSCSPSGTPRSQSVTLPNVNTEPELLSEEAYASGRMSLNSTAASDIDRKRPCAICSCPCRNCATCPLRGSPPHPTASGSASGGLGRKRPSGAHKTRTSLESTDAQAIRVGSESPTAASASSQCNTVVSEKTPHTVGLLKGCFSRTRGVVRSTGRRFETMVLNLLYLEEAQTDPPRYSFDSRVIPPIPLKLKHQRFLAITELPFLILWVYFTYWVVIVSMTAHRCTSTVWISAMIAGLLVGIGLNANAYKSVTVPRRRGSVRHHRHVRALLELHKYGEGIEKVEMVVDWGIVIRFFIIPFGVSSLSGLTNSARDQFLLVFPRDPVYLTVALLCPAVIVACLFTLRVFLLWYLRVRWSLAVLFLNGALVD